MNDNPDEETEKQINALWFNLLCDITEDFLNKGAGECRALAGCLTRPNGQDDFDVESYVHQAIAAPASSEAN